MNKDYQEGFGVGKLGLSYDENQTREWQEGWCEGKKEHDRYQHDVEECDNPYCHICNEEADKAEQAIANGEYAREY